MKTRAAVLTAPHAPFEIMELDIDEPGPGEVMLKITAAGLCHSDLHMLEGDLDVRYPMVGGHEAAGVVEKVGQGVTKVAVGDHVVCSFIPSCGTCRYCSTGRQNLCDAGMTILEGCMPDGTFRLHSQRRPPSCSPAVPSRRPAPPLRPPTPLFDSWWRRRSHRSRASSPTSSGIVPR